MLAKWSGLSKTADQQERNGILHAGRLKGGFPAANQDRGRLVIDERAQPQPKSKPMDLLRVVVPKGVGCHGMDSVPRCGG